MPARAWRERLQDILAAIADIQSDTQDMTFEQFRSDSTTVRSVIFSFVVIGEAVRGAQGFHAELPADSLAGHADDAKLCSPLLFQH